MTREERVDSLIEYLKKENPSYDTLQEPYDYDGKRRLLRSLMNVRFPMGISEEYLVMQDELLGKGQRKKGLWNCQIYRRSRDLSLYNDKKYR